MRHALTLPPFGEWADPALLVDVAVTAESAGWDAVFLWDHIYGGDWAGDVLDPWIVMAAQAAATNRIRLGPMVTPLPRRRPAKVARESVTLDHLSGGRLTLGVGIGWPPDEDFGQLGDAADNRIRGEQLDEALEVLTALWSGQRVHHEGTHYRAMDVQFTPTPQQEPRIPIWVAGMWPRKPAFRRAARFDGVFPITVGDDFEIAPTYPADLEAVVAFTREHRTTDAPFDVAVGGSHIEAPETSVEAYRRAGATWWVESIGFPGRTTSEWLDYVAEGPPDT